MKNRPADKSVTTAIIVVAVVAIVIAVAALMNLPDRRTPGERLGDATEELSEGVRDAGEALERRTAGERVRDAVRDAREEMSN